MAINKSFHIFFIFADSRQGYKITNIKIIYKLSLKAHFCSLYTRDLQEWSSLTGFHWLLQTQGDYKYKHSNMDNLHKNSIKRHELNMSNLFNDTAGEN